MRLDLVSGESDPLTPEEIERIRARAQPDTIPGKEWGDGTPIWFGKPFPEPWGTDPRDRWVRVMAEFGEDGVWMVDGSSGLAEELPVPETVLQRLRAWQDWHDRLDFAYSKRYTDEKMYWEAFEDAPLDEFNAEGEAITQTLRDALPGDWKVVHGPLCSSYG